MRPGRARRTEVHLGDALSGSVFREGIAGHIVSYSPRRHVPGGRREPDVGRKVPQGLSGPRSSRRGVAARGIEMDLDFTEEQEMLREMVRGVCAEHCSIEVVRDMEDDPTG